ncbi:hypothetical protein EV385_2762 [Krasilnikovia cinnamomea]|uniref:Uncharacterized protein n=1 Tax=Krasilnikovia cinnamomea TaxID=349313 RepID=A0A4Q7ZJB9_9ACTN|nr:hypothetical protein EV385_2762 [Krasilnikovia cinnamomea]
MDLTLAGALAVIWLAAGLLADALPTAGSARELRRRAGTLILLVLAGAALFVAVPVVTSVVEGPSAAVTAALLPAVPAMVVLGTTLRRLTALRGGAGAFTTAPRAPLPPALRAAAAHPLIATPLQATGIAALVGLPVAAFGMPTAPGGNLAAIAITLAGLAVVAVGIRHALRHSRLSVLVLAPIRRRATRIG